MQTDYEIGRAFAFGGVRTVGLAVLAPMTGLTDVPFRRIAARYGAGMVVTEMVASGALVRRDAAAQVKAEGQGIRPHVVQLVGRDPRLMAEAARIAEANGADIVDLNFGCPAKRVTGGMAGSALMKEPDLAGAIAASVAAAVRVPVTAKMRLGWDGASLNAADLVRRLDELGLAGFTVHGRTRQQFYTGRADPWAVAPAVAATGRPVLVNGDIRDLREARNAMRASGAAGIMVGRAAIGRPWLIGELAAGLAGATWREPGPAERADVAAEHYEALLELYGYDVGRRAARKHLAAYADQAAADGWGLPDAERRELVVVEDPARVVSLLRRAFAEAGRLAA